MSALLCPSCGAPVPLRSAAMPYAVCAYCQTVLMREGAGETMGLRHVGKSATLPFDVSPIQLGTRGLVRDDLGFEVVGRVRWGWSHGSWNEWLARCDDGSHRWIGEAMGSFMLLAEDDSLLTLPMLKRFAEGDVPTIGTKLNPALVVSDVKEARCIAGEGDLPFPTAPDWTMTSVDFRSASDSALSVQRDANGITAWSGRYLTLGELKPTNLRAIEGWAIPEPLP